MLSRSQILVLTGFLACGTALGAVAPRFLAKTFPASISIAPKTDERKLPLPSPRVASAEKDAPKEAKPLATLPRPGEPTPSVASPLKPGQPENNLIALKADPVPPKLKVDPEVVLKRRGLTRSDQVYVLAAEDKYRAGFENLRDLRSMGSHPTSNESLSSVDDGRSIRIGVLGAADRCQQQGSCRGASRV